MKSVAITNLKALAKIYYSKKYPNVPEHALVMPAFRNSKNHKEITKCILEYFKYVGAIASISKQPEEVFKSNTATLFSSSLSTKTKRSKKKEKFTHCSVITAVNNGKPIIIELSQNPVSVYKKTEIDRFVADGGAFILTDGYDDFIKKLNQT